MLLVHSWKYLLSAKNISIIKPIENYQLNESEED